MILWPSNLQGGDSITNVMPGKGAPVFCSFARVSVKMHQEHNIQVVVKYMAAAKPFTSSVPPTTTVAALKSDVLSAFQLKEDSTKTYKLFDGKTELADPSQLLSAIAGHANGLKLTLEEVLIQGG